MKTGAEIGKSDGVMPLGYVMREHADGWRAFEAMLEIALDERHVRDSNREYWERLIRDHAERLSQTGDGLQRRAGALQDRLEMLLELASTAEK